MEREKKGETHPHVVLVNHEQQYSLWILGAQLPVGWAVTYGPGSKEQCLDYVKATWTDMRPLSLRSVSERDDDEQEGRITTVEPLTRRLAVGTHPVAYRARRNDARGELKQAVGREYIYVEFAETRGGTEVGFQLDVGRSDLSHADWESGAGTIHLEGRLTLDGVPTRCVVDLELRTLKGAGRLNPI